MPMTKSKTSGYLSIETTGRFSRTSVLCAAALVLVLLSSSFCEKASAQESPEKVAVLPVFVVPKGQRAPEKQDSQLFARHLLWTQTRYREMLGNKSTFRIQKKIETLRSKWTVADFEKSAI